MPMLNDEGKHPYSIMLLPPCFIEVHFTNFKVYQYLCKSLYRMFFYKWTVEKEDFIFNIMFFVLIYLTYRFQSFGEVYFLLSYHVIIKVLSLENLFTSDPAHDRTYSRSASPPENGFKQYLETRLYKSQGKGPIRTERVPHLGGRSSHDPLRSSHDTPHSSDPPRSPRLSHDPSRSPRLSHDPPRSPRSSHDPPRIHTRLQVPPSTAILRSGNKSRRPEHLINGYDTDSSQDSRDRNGRSNNHSSRAWRPMREALNVDSILSSVDDGNAQIQEHRLHSPRRRTSSHSPSRDHEQDRDLTWGALEERKPKSLMTIYEDEQKNETGGSRSSLDSDTRDGHNDTDRSKGSANLKLRNDNWKIQRTESGYESSDRLSNGSANLDSPIVDGLSSKDLRPIPELHLMR